MRNLALIALLSGAVGFFYCGSQMSLHPPVPENARLSQALDYPAGRWQLGQYASAFVGFLGFLTLMMPKR